MSPEVPRLNLRCLVRERNSRHEMNISADRRPYLPPRRVFVSVPPHKATRESHNPDDEDDDDRPSPLTAFSERPSTPPLISSPASFGPSSPHTRSSPISDPRITAPSPGNQWNCFKTQSALFDQSPSNTSQTEQRTGHNRVRSAGAAVVTPTSMLSRTHTRAGLLHITESHGIRGPYGFLFAGGNVQTGVPHTHSAASGLGVPISASLQENMPVNVEISIPLQPQSGDSSTVKTIKYRRDYKERNLRVGSLKELHSGILRAEKAVLASVGKLESNVLAHVDSHLKSMEDRLRSIERQLITLKPCYPLSKTTIHAQRSHVRESACAPVEERPMARLHPDAPTSFLKTAGYLEEFQLCSELNVQRGNSADTLFDNLSERNRSPHFDSDALVRATEGLTAAVSALLDRMGHPPKSSETGETQMEVDPDESSNESVKVMEVK